VADLAGLAPVVQRGHQTIGSRRLFHPT
jgi:hypothetical protein